MTSEKPWLSEPDREEWIDEETGLDCMIIRNPIGVLCGYVAVPPDHALFGVDYASDAVDGIAVHGGLTYSNECAGHICHVPKDGRPDHVWWFGFDTGHLFDYVPGWDETSVYGELNVAGSTYKDIGYVRDECRDLARQLRDLA